MSADKSVSKLGTVRDNSFTLTTVSMIDKSIMTLRLREFDPFE